MPVVRYVDGALSPLEQVEVVQRAREHASRPGAARAYDEGSRIQSRDGEKRPRQALQVRQIMTSDVICLREDATLQDARAALAGHPFHHLPIVRASGEIAGILSERDILRTAATAASTAVTEVMSRDVLGTRPASPVRDVAAMMLDHVIGSLVVIDTEHRVAGIVTTTDILRAIVARAPLDLWA